MRTWTIAKISASILLSAIGSVAVAQGAAGYSLYNPGAASPTEMPTRPSRLSATRSLYNPGAADTVDSNATRISSMRSAFSPGASDPAEIRLVSATAVSRNTAFNPGSMDPVEMPLQPARVSPLQSAYNPGSWKHISSDLPAVPPVPPSIPATPAKTTEPMPITKTAAAEQLPAPVEKSAAPAKPCEPANADAVSQASAKPRFGQRWRRAFTGSYWAGADPSETIPAGNALYSHGKAMVAKGEAALMMLHDFDFVQGSGELNQRGRDQLTKMTALLACTFNPIIVERTPLTPGLADARRQSVLRALANGPFPVPPDRVVIGQSPVLGLSGNEAGIIYQNLTRQTEAMGGGSGGGGGGASGGATGTGTTGGATPQR